jgi:predicted dehydrogenase
VVVGTGFGTRVHVPALRNAGFDVVALVGRDPDRTARRAARLGIARSCTTLADALSSAGVDAVTIATPPDTHADLAIEACEAARHVICEKPFAADAAEAVHMRDAAERAGVTNLVGHEFRWAPDRAVVARAIHAGMIGEPRLFTLTQYVSLVADAGVRMPPWWFDELRGGGWLGASGSHVIDQLRTWLGEFDTVSATLPSVRADAQGAEDSFVVRVTMANGAHGVLQQTAASWAPGAIGVSVVAGTSGTIDVGPAGVWLSDRDGRRLLGVPDDLRLPAAPARVDNPREAYTHLELGPYTRVCEASRAGVEGANLPTAVPLPTFEDGVAEMQVLDAIRASAAARGTTITLAATRRTPCTS